MDMDMGMIGDISPNNDGTLKVGVHSAGSAQILRTPYLRPVMGRNEELGSSAFSYVSRLCTVTSWDPRKRGPGAFQ